MVLKAAAQIERMTRWTIDSFGRKKICRVNYIVTEYWNQLIEFVWFVQYWSNLFGLFSLVVRPAFGLGWFVQCLVWLDLVWFVQFGLGWFIQFDCSFSLMICSAFGLGWFVQWYLVLFVQCLVVQFSLVVRLGWFVQFGLVLIRSAWFGSDLFSLVCSVFDSFILVQLFGLFSCLFGYSLVVLLIHAIDGGCLVCLVQFIVWFGLFSLNI